MRVRDEERQPSLQADLTPLINIVFLMLVFFMLAGSLRPGDDIQPASIDSDRAVDDGLLVISVDREGWARVDGAAVNDESLLVLLEEQQARGGRAGIRPDARLEAQRLVEVTDLLRKAGFEQMVLVAQAR